MFLFQRQRMACCGAKKTAGVAAVVSEIVTAKQSVYDGFKAALTAGVPEDKAGNPILATLTVQHCWSCHLRSAMVLDEKLIAISVFRLGKMVNGKWTETRWNNLRRARLFSVLARVCAACFLKAPPEPLEQYQKRSTGPSRTPQVVELM